VRGRQLPVGDGQPRGLRRALTAPAA
jgi:hypothetical protein